MFIPFRKVRREIGRRRARFLREINTQKVLKDNLSLTGTNDTAKGPERTKCPFGESRKYIVKEGSELKVKLTLSFVKEGTELVEKFTPSLGIHATAKEIAYSESSILTKTYLMISLTSSE